MPDPTVLRAGLVDAVLRATGPIGPPIVEALRTVPRHLFLPEVPVEDAYRDDAIVTKRDPRGRPISSSSQPTIMALMLDQLAPAPGHRVLEIGAGTGYNAALLAHLVRPGGRVVSVDIDADLVERAAAGLARTGYPEAAVVRGDGGLGVPERAPYDRVIATVGVWDLAPAWLAQIAPGGRLVAPLDLGGIQCSVAFERCGEHWRSRSVVPCGFMRLRGAFAGPERTLVLDPEAQLAVMLPGGGAAEPAALRGMLAAPPVVRLPAPATGASDMFGGLGLWLGARERRYCQFSEGGATGPILPSAPAQLRDLRMTVGLFDRDGVALLGAEPHGATVAFGYGAGGGRLAGDLVGHIRAWEAAGRPGVAGLRIDAYPRAAPPPPPDGATVIEKAHTRLLLSWPVSRP
ncbi:methyltransferase, FxLD system [Rhizomonospora bruguierae]|uniref:methyltransferase, FxLD system n=1 Tax=Rhizomonospora bruguierae TaxID=1581705 RepID=UPI001BD04578|nr:methyltransferase, FxLD system [Micromonospora sp. NBRC 107566]